MTICRSALFYKCNFEEIVQQQNRKTRNNRITTLEKWTNNFQRSSETLTEVAYSTHLISQTISRHFTAATSQSLKIARTKGCVPFR